VRGAAIAGLREPGRVSIAAETTARLTPSVEGSWPPQPAAESAPIAPPRRSTATEDPWLPPEPAPAPRARPAPADSLTGLAAELSSKFGSAEMPAARAEPMPRTAAAPPVAPPPEIAPAQNDRNLAEMAQQLEAALRRAPSVESRPPVTDPLAVPPTAKMAPRPAARPRQEPKFEPKFDSKFEPKFDAKRDLRAEPKFELKPEAPTAPDRNLYDNLEEEMASLLGRPPDKP